MSSLITVIIPTYNRAHLIGETLDSILAQTYTDWECIIVDDVSTDDTQKVVDGYLKKDKRFQYHQRPVNTIKGANSCRNYGFEVSKGSYIQFFDSDDFMQPHCLETKINCFKPETDVVVCKLSFYDFQNNIELKQNNIISNDLLYDYFCGRVSLYVCGPLWLRKFLENQIILFDESIINCDDWDFNMRMLYQFPKYEMIDQSLILYRIHSSSMSFQILNNNLEEIRNVSGLLDIHLSYLAALNNINIVKYVKYVIQFNKYYLLKSILKSDPVKKKLTKKILVYCFNYGFFLEFIKVILGRLSFLILKKGAILFK
jgi:glycosyltransferase involved in cell wall biosynthesis